MSDSSDKDKADRGNDTASDAPYEVGNKKPPRHAQFKPGVSGNPKGRPKGSVNLHTRVRQGLRKTVMVNRNGRPTRMQVLDIISNRLLEASMKGDLKTIQYVMQSDQASATDAPAEDETANLAVGATPDNKTLRRMLARFSHLQSKDAEADS